MTCGRGGIPFVAQCSRGSEVIDAPDPVTRACPTAWTLTRERLPIQLFPQYARSRKAKKTHGEESTEFGKEGNKLGNRSVTRCYRFAKWHRNEKGLCEKKSSRSLVSCASTSVRRTFTRSSERGGIQMGVLYTRSEGTGDVRLYVLAYLQGRNAMSCGGRVHVHYS